VLSLAILGCGDGKIVRYPVTGTVKVDGKPVTGAMVVLCPVEGPEELMRERPVGSTGPDGKFLLTTLEKDDGAPAGQYKVLVQWLSGAPQGDVDRGGGPVDRLRGKYFNLERTPLTATISEGPTDLPPFELMSR